MGLPTQMRSTLLLVLVLFACAESTPSVDPQPNHPQPDAGRSQSDASAPDDAGCPSCADRAVTSDSEEPPLPPNFLSDTGDGWQMLAAAYWSLEAGRETYLCVYVTVPSDTFVSSFKSLTPPGTHHATLSVDTGASTPDGKVEDCGPAIMHRQIYASGTTEMVQELPAGVAMPLRAGEQLILRLHLFNTGTETLEGYSGVVGTAVNEGDVEHMAGAVLAGPVQLMIPPGTVTQTGQCTLGSAATIFSVFPHMHTLGRSMKVIAETAGDGEHVLFDGPFEFEEQPRYELEPLLMQAGDRIRVECTYENDTSTIVNFGDSTLQEMCFAGLSTYPPIAGQAICFN